MPAFYNLETVKGLTSFFERYIVSMLIVSKLTIGGDCMKTPFHFLLFKTFHAQRNHIRTDMDTYGLSPGQPKVLRYIATHKNCKLKDIAQECDVEPATVSKLLNDLEDLGMLTRKIDPKNKRAYQLCITEKGSIALTKWNLHCDEVEELSLKGFDEQEKEQFKSYLSRMYHNLSGKNIE